MLMYTASLSKCDKTLLSRTQMISSEVEFVVKSLFDSFIYSFIHL